MSSAPLAAASPLHGVGGNVTFTAGRETISELCRAFVQGGGRRPSDASPIQTLTVEALKISSIEWPSDLSNSASDIW
jgi:hypothetical protein